MKCHLCGGSGAKTVKFKTGHILPQCEECSKLGVQANLERLYHGEEMNIFKPCTFRVKPNCSKIWLMAYCATTIMSCH